MILFTLRCTNGHEFEAWFRDGAGFEAQHAAGEIACPHCGDTSVEKAVMAPRLARSREAVPPEVALAQMRKTLSEMRRQIENHCDYVGPRFAEEARRIHYGETDPHAIYGEATDAESRDLVDEGIKFGQIPWVPRTDG
ncbi:MAG TPA: DUF1178 family protein [Stellaceae bacterium]|jgi:hypothetical protein|nr:DUF1178 family protein [Stellaceae bacterium]